MKITCFNCKEPQEVPITQKQLDDYRISGAFVQVYFPELTDDEREMLISGTCNRCWDEMFSEDEDV